MKMHYLNMMIIIVTTIIIALISYSITSSIDDLNLPPSHIPYYLYNNPHLLERCLEDNKCLFKNISISDDNKCWGYEQRCKSNQTRYFSYPECPGGSRGWTKSKEEQKNLFWRQGDFGYVLGKIDTMSVLCKSKSENGASLTCAENMVYCRAKNIFMNFKNLRSKENTGSLDKRYRENIFNDKYQVGGFCDLKKSLLKKQGEWKSALQSWYAELEAYSQLSHDPFAEDNIDHSKTSRTNDCDVTLDKPTVFMKLDAGVNLFHHYCDFINLYASQHINNSFDQDINVVMWDTSNMNYFDICPETWKVFSHHPVIHLKEFDGKKVCVKEAMFPLLARMRFGLYYNMPVVDGCSGSGLFQAFNYHLVHRLNIPQNGPLANGVVRVTLLTRSTKYRRILNQQELINAMKTRLDIYLNVLDYKYGAIPFLDQVTMTHNSDIFIGMHGAGLAHVLFQPDWGVLFELYNCDDKSCYYDLARLRGANYLTWEKIDKLVQEDEGHHPTLGAHKKFTNYAFDVTEFMRLVDVGINHVRSHPAYLQPVSTKHKTVSKTSHTEL